MSMRRSVGGVLFADVNQLNESVTSAPYLRYGLYGMTEMAIATCAAVSLGLKLTPRIENSVETLMFGLIG